MTSDASVTVLQLRAEQFARSFAVFVEALRGAVTGNITNAAVANSPVFLIWQTQGLPLLERENASIQNAMALFLVGDVKTIIRLASDNRALGKKLDGFSLDFAGPDHAKTLNQLETAVVVAAYQLCVVAGIP